MLFGSTIKRSLTIFTPADANPSTNSNSTKNGIPKMRNNEAYISPVCRNKTNPIKLGDAALSVASTNFYLSGYAFLLRFVYPDRLKTI